MRTPRGTLVAIAVVVASTAGRLHADDTALRGTLQRVDGGSLQGRLAGDAAAGYRFMADGDGGVVRLKAGSVLTFDSGGPEPTAGSPPFRVELGLGRRISGWLGRVDAAGVRFDDSAAGGPLTVPRAGVRSIVQRLGEVQVIDDGFESLRGTRWTLIGGPEIADQPRISGDHSLRMPAGGASLTSHLSAPVATGRLEVAFHDRGEVVAGHQWFVDLLFRGPAGPETVRVILGWAEESLSVESPGGPALVVQRLERRKGWHRLSIRFGPEQTEIAVDGNDLAHGKGAGGPLVEVRLATHGGGEDAPADLAGHFDDLRLVRFSEPVSGLEVDTTQDEVRLAGGDQVFGTLRDADPARVKIEVDGQQVTLAWSEVSGIHLRRAAAQSDAVEGLLVRVDWRAAPGGDPRDMNRADGALRRIGDDTLTIDAPYAGPLTISRQRLTRLEVLGRARRIVLDATAHHLGNQFIGNPEPLDPPQPEGGQLERSLDLPAVPQGPVFLTFDVLQVAGEASGLRFSEMVKRGEARTNVRLNGRIIDYLNRHISSKNETPERIRVPVPSGLLHAGTNQLRLEQVGTASDPSNLDDLGVLEIGVELPLPPAADEKS